MKKIILGLLVLGISMLSALQMSDFSLEEQENITNYLSDKIELESGETIKSVEGDKYQITEATDDFVIVVDKDGNIIFVPR
jgi:hypothetical protein